jgi:recombination protein RecA
MPKKKTKTSGSLSLALKDIEKKYGTGSIMRLVTGEQPTQIDTLSTGVFSLDRILGGGIARGRVAELYGSEGSGKTTLALQVVVEAQRAGLTAAYIDVEHSFSLEYAKSLGANLEELLFAQPNSAEEAMNIARTLAESGEVAVIVIDSVAALTPESEFEADVGKTQIGHLARFMSTSLKQMVSIFSRTNTTLIFINQIRMKIGIAFGNPETTSGGNALKYYSTQRIQLRRRTKIANSDGGTIGYLTSIRVEKNKIAMPFQATDVNFLNGKGFDRVSDLLYSGLKYGVIEKPAATYIFKGEKIAVGEKKALTAIREDEKLQEEIIKELETVFNLETND